MKTASKKAAVAAEWKLTPVRSFALSNTCCDRPTLAAKYWHKHIATAPNYSAEVEWVAVLVLNPRLCPRGHYIVSQGTLSAGLAHPREVFRAAIVSGAFAFVLMHNHPSGDPSPSDEDRDLTARLRDAARLLQIRLHDHVIVGAGKRYFSFTEAGLIGPLASPDALTNSPAESNGEDVHPAAPTKNEIVSAAAHLVDFENTVYAAQAMSLVLESLFIGERMHPEEVPRFEESDLIGLSHIAQRTREELRECFRAICERKEVA